MLKLLHMTVVLTMINFCVYSAHNFSEFEYYAVQKLLNAHSLVAHKIIKIIIFLNCVLIKLII